MPGARVVPRRAAQLRRAHARRATSDADAIAVIARSQTRGPSELTLRRARDQVGRAPRRAAAARRRPRRPGRRVHAEHPRDARGLPGHREPGRDLGLVRARVRRPQRRRPLRPDRADRAARGRRLRLRRPASRPARRGGGDPRGAADARARRRRPLREAACPTRWRGRSCSPSRGPLAFDAGAVRPPAVRAVLLGHHRAAEGHRARPRRHPARAPQAQACSSDLRPGDRPLWFTTTAWTMWNVLVSALLLRASIVMLDGNPLWPGPRRAVAAGRRSRRDAAGRQPRPT